MNETSDDFEADQVESPESMEAATHARAQMTETIDLSKNELVTMLPEEWTALARQKKGIY
jgi:hypothetical protein